MSTIPYLNVNNSISCKVEERKEYAIQSWSGSASKSNQVCLDLCPICLQNLIYSYHYVLRYLAHNQTNAGKNITSEAEVVLVSHREALKTAVREERAVALMLRCVCVCIY